MDKIKTASHGEKEILNGCIGLMYEVYQNMLNYLDFQGINVKEIDQEEQPCFYISYFRIVQRLFLLHTSHSGGTSTREKCYELGVDSSDTVKFDCDDYEPDYY